MSRDELNALRAEVKRHDELTRSCADLQSALDMLNDLQELEHERLGRMSPEDEAVRAEWLREQRENR